MTTDDPFLHAIIASPDDDALRLVYADFLEEHGQTDRAQFIRVQIELARLLEDDPASAGLRAQAAALLDTHKDEWLGPLTRLAEDWSLDPFYGFRRGFVERLSLAAANYFGHGEAIFRANPVRSLTLSATAADLRRLTESPDLARLTALDVKFYGLEDAFPVGEFGTFLSSSRLSQLRHFGVSGKSIGVAGVEALVAAPVLSRLSGLAISGTHLDARAVRVLTASPWLRGLTSLCLDNNCIGLEGVRLVANCPYLAGLTELGLGFNYVGDGCGQALAASPYLHRLTDLYLSECDLRDAGVQALATSPTMAHLRSLIIDYNHFTAAAVRALVGSSPLTGLTTLWLSLNRLGDAGAELVSGSRSLAGMTELSLHSCGIRDAGARALAESPYLGGLLRLDLRFNPLSSEGEQRLRDRFGDRVAFDRRKLPYAD